MYRSFHFSFRSFVSSVLSFSSPFQYIRCTVSQCVIVAALFPKPPPPPSPENPTCVYKQAVLWYYVAGAACTRMLLHRTHRCNVASTYKVTFHALFPDAGPARTTNAAGVPLIYKRKGRDRVASPDYFRIIPINTECKRSAFLAEARARVDNFNRLQWFFSFFAVNVFFIRLNFEIIVGGGWDWFFEKSGEPRNKKDCEIGL